MRGKIFVGASATFVVLGLFLFGSRLTHRSSEFDDKYVLRIGLLGFPSNLNVFKANDLNVHIVLSPVHRGLVRYNQLGQIEGDLAQSWEIDSRNRRIVFHLSPDLRDKSGRPISCLDVEASFRKALQGHRTPAVNFDVTCPDSSRVTIENYSEPDSLLPILTRIYFSVLPADQVENSTSYSGLGNYEITAHSDAEIHLERRSENPVGPKEIIFVIYESGSRAIEGFTRGEVELISLGVSTALPTNLQKFARTSPIYSARWFISFGSDSFWINHPAQRRCLNWNIDRAGIVAKLNKNNLHIADLAFGFLGRRERQGLFKPTDLIPLSGSCTTGHKARHEMIYVLESTPELAVIEVERQLRALGVDILLHGLNRAEFTKKFFGRKFDLAFLGFGASDSPAESLMTFYSKKSFVPLVPLELKVAEREVENLFINGSNEFTLRAFEEKMWKQSPIMPLFFEEPLYLINPCLKLITNSTHSPLLDLSSIKRVKGCREKVL